MSKILNNNDSFDPEESLDGNTLDLIVEYDKLATLQEVKKIFGDGKDFPETKVNLYDVTDKKDKE